MRPRETAIADAAARAAKSNVANVRFTVGSVFDSGLPAGSFDVAVLCGVLGHIPDRDRALRHVTDLLKPGGIIAVRDMHKEADWWSGAHSEAVGRFNGLVAGLIRGGGGDPFIGGRLKRVLLDAGFVNVVAEPSYSRALSTTTSSVPFILGRVREPGFIDRIVANGDATREELGEIANEIELWSQSPDAMYAIAECVALGSKPL
ncbi:MAG TPA: methyltransferase domain-containing protein [Candidatus Lustribacter sp.]|nr:methyltransferase domain-containing protein [Candidatus Lustribacter sp.]